MQFFPFMSTDTSQVDAFAAKTRGSAKAVSSRLSAKADDARESFSKLLESEIDPFTDNSKRGKAVVSMWDKARSGAQTVSRWGRRGGTGAEGEERLFGSANPKAARSGKGGVFNLRSLMGGGGAGVLGGGTGTGVKELSELRMTREDFLKLKGGLREFGLSKLDLDALEERIASEGGLTWGQFMAALSEKMVSMGREFAPVKLTQAEALDLQNFFQSVGFTPGKSKELLSQLRSGATTSVWKEVSAKLAQQPEGTTIDLSSSQLATLGKVMKLSESGQARLTGLLGGADSASLSPKQLGTVMTVLKAEVAADAEYDSNTNQALRKLVGQALSDAAGRADLARQADTRTDNNVRNQKILGQESRRERAAEHADGQQGQTGDKGHAERVLEADPHGKASRNTAAASAASAKGGAKDAAGDPNAAKDGGKDAQARLGTDGSGRYFAGGAKNGGGEFADQFKGGKGSSEGETETAWKEMWGKVRVDRRGEAQAEAARTTETRFAAMPGVSEQANAKGRVRPAAEITARAIRQVETGILKNMGNGRSQLTLRLDPAELGKLNMILSMKDGELTATFRAETQDGHRMLSEQLAHLKSQLEQQGIKVAKMEVQTQLQGDQNSNQWLGEGRHNQAQEQGNFAKRQGLLRQLRGDSDELAQEMQNETRTAEIAREGLDIIA